MDCKYFWSYSELYDDDPLEPDYCGECRHDKVYETIIDSNEKKEWATQADEDNKCNDFEKR